MKKLFSLLLCLIALTVMFVNCSDEENEAPTITPFSVKVDGSGVNEQSGTYAAGTDITFEFTVNKTDLDLKEYTIQEKIGSNAATVLKTEDVSDVDNSSNETYTYTVPDVESGTEVVVTITIYDEEDNEDSRVFTITVSASVDSYTVTLGAHENTTGSFYSSANKQAYTVSEAANNQSKIDLIYYYGASNGATLAAPDDASLTDFTTYGVADWTTKNSTRLAKVSTAFTSLTGASAIQTAYNAATADSKVTGLQVNDVVVFKTVAGKYGALLITDIVTGTDGTMSLSAQVQM